MHSVAATTGRWPAGFNAAEFVRHARLNFVRLQEAYDKKDLSTMRDFLTPDVYREIEADIRAAGSRGGADRGADARGRGARRRAKRPAPTS